MRKLMLTTVLLTLAFAASAQDKYRFAVVSYWPVKGKLFIYKDGASDESKGVKSTSTIDATPILLEVEKMSAEGWEVYSSNATSHADGSVG